MSRRTPGFTAAAVLVLALGLGANTALFSVVRGILLRPLPYHQPDRLVVLKDAKLPQFSSGIEVAPGHFFEWRARSVSFEDIGAYRSKSVTLSGGAVPERVHAVSTSAGLFSMLGIQPMLGRDFRAEEERPGRDPIVIVSYGFWQQRFGGKAGLLGRQVTLNGRSHTVVGIMPPLFGFPAPGVELWTPIAFSAEERATHGNHDLLTVARLKSGVSLAQATLEMNRIAEQLEREFPKMNAGWRVRIEGLLESNVQSVRPRLLMLLAAVGLVLLVACANVANLLLARATSRRGELAIRAAMGATRGRLVRQTLTESVLLAMGGGGAGMALAAVSLPALPVLVPDLPRLGDIRLDGAVLAFGGVLAVSTGLLFGIVPAFFADTQHLANALKESSRCASADGRRRRIRHALVVAEVALALVLLVGAGLLAKSFWLLQRVDPGFRPDHTFVGHLDLPDVAYTVGPQTTTFFRRVVEDVAALPGVDAVGVAHTLPFLADQQLGFTIAGRPAYPEGERPSADYYAVSPGYFDAIGVRLIAGRLFTQRDREGAPGVVIINETMARHYFAGGNAIGGRIHLTNGVAAFREVVGIVGDVRQDGLDDSPSNQVYEPFPQQRFLDPDMWIVVRASVDVSRSVREAIAHLDATLPLSDVQSLEAAISRSLNRPRATAQLLTLFAVVALWLAAVGIYGVLAYSVAQRSREVGIRMALGASPGDVRRLVVREALRPVLLGIVVGLAAAAALARLMSELLYGVQPSDPATYLVMPPVLLLVALLSAYMPARRATKVDPLAALRTT